MKARAVAVPWRFVALSLLLSLIVAAAYLALRDTPVIGAIEGQSLNWRFQLRGALPPPPQVAIIAFDDRSIAALGHWPAPRRLLAAAVQKLLDNGAAVVGIDLLLLDPGRGETPGKLSSDDQAFLDTLKRSDRIIMAVACTFAPDAQPAATDLRIASEAAFGVVSSPSGVSANAVLTASGLEGPFPPLDAAVSLGHVNMPVGSDGTLRYTPAAARIGPYFVPAFPLEVARRFMGVSKDAMALDLSGGLDLGDRRLSLDRRLRIPINFYGPAGSITSYSLIDLLQDRLAEKDIRGRAILLGATALGLGDSFTTPFSQATPGVEVLATTAGNLIAGEMLVRAGLRDWDLAAILLLGLLAFVLARLPMPLASTAAAVVLIAIWAAVSLLAFRRGLWLDMTFPTAAILVNTTLVATLRTHTVLRMRRNLAGYHSPAIVDMLAKSDAPSFEGSYRAAIMFVDITGFTARVERLEPAETVRVLRDFHARIERAVLGHGGVLDLFMGDGAMIVFGVPAPSANDAAAALDCAQDLLADIRQHNEDLRAEGQSPFRVSIGIHIGEVMVAKLGGPTQAQMSTTGDTVNVASRLEALTRQHDAAIAISGAVYDAVAAAGKTERLREFERLPTQILRGRAGGIVVWIRRRQHVASG